MSETPSSPGPGVDREGRPVIDPTKNVLDLVQAAKERLDDLRTVSEEHAKQLRLLEQEHGRELRRLESERIDAIRAVDVAASQQQQKDAELRATALAKQVADAAEAMRNQVAAAAQAAATSLAAALVPIQERLAELTRLQYEQQGQKAQVIEARSAAEDLAPMVAAIEALTSAQDKRAGAGEQRLQTRGSITFAQGAIGTFVMLVLFALAVYAALHTARPVTPLPQVTVTVTQTIP